VFPGGSIVARLSAYAATAAGISAAKLSFPGRLAYKHLPSYRGRARAIQRMRDTRACAVTNVAGGRMRLCVAKLDKRIAQAHAY